MAISQAVFQTAVPSRYINRLCRHWSHKFEVVFDDSRGEIRLGDALCTLRAGDGVLTVVIDAADEKMAELEQVVFAHLERFAPPDEVLQGEWVRQTD